MPLGPVPLASDASGDGFQNYNQVSGRATAVAIDPADASGNTVYVGGAQGGVWKSGNAATALANSVTWTAVTDDQATLSTGAIAIQPGNSNPGQSVIVVGTGEADNAADSYFGLGILRSADGGNSWTLISSDTTGVYSFSGLGATRMAFSTATGQASTVVAAMAATAEGLVDGALTTNTYRGLYTSMDAGQTWTYDALFAGGATEATSATSVVYNAAAGLFFAALRYHGFYSSPDGVTWTALANQPGGPGALSAAACPQNYATTCPIYRGEITVVPGRNEMYVWFVSLSSSNTPVDQGIWQSEDGGVTWTQISDSGITNCGDLDGCGVEQGFYNLELLAVPDGAATDLYAGAINLYKCGISSVNPTCTNTPFLNLTHAYGCDPLGALAHVHPDQHALAYTIPSSGAELMYFANDGGIYRALNGYTGLLTGSCSGTNQFDDLNQNLGSMTQFVSFSQHPTNVDMLLGGSQDNGSPATATATTSSGWGNVLSGDGGYNAIDANSGNWFASQPDTGDGTLNVQECSSGISCTDSLFNVVVSSDDVGGDDGAYYFPYILDPQSTSSMLVGTCRVWTGPRSGGAFTELSLNFDTLGIGTCAGTEVNTIRSLAGGGPANANGSEVIYATTDGPGPGSITAPLGGNVWVTTNAEAISGVSSTFSNVTLNGPGGNSINANQFPISGVAIDTSDPTGNTAYVTVMGFTGGPGHVWQTTNAGASWTDFTGTGRNALPDSPTNAVIVDPVAHIVYVGSDVGVFQSSTIAPAWTEVGPIPNPLGTSTGFLPEVAVTALAIFNSGGQKLLRASTYGRGVWQFNLLAVPTFQITISNTPLTVFSDQTGVFNGTITAINGYNDNVAIGCVAGSSSAPSPCIASPATLTPTQLGAAFTVSAQTGSVTDYNFNVQGVGFDPNGTTEVAPVTLDVVSWSITAPSPPSVMEPRGATSPPVSFEISAQGTFSQTVSLSCSFIPSIVGATCAFTPGTSFNLTSASPVNATVSVTVPAGTTTGNYGVTVQAGTAGATLTTSFIADVITNPNFVLALTDAPFPNVKAGSSGTTGSLTLTSQDGFTGNVLLSCVAPAGGSCVVTPSVSVPLTGSATATLTINAGTLAAGNYQISIQGISGSITNSLIVPFVVDDYVIAGPSTVTSIPGSAAVANLTFSSADSYSGQVDVLCDASALSGAQCSLSPASPIPIGSGAVIPVAVTIAVPTSAVAGTYNINLSTHDASGEPTHPWPIALTVQDFIFGPVTPPPQMIGAGQSASYNLSVMPVGASFSSPVAVSCSVSPTGPACKVSPASVTPNSSAAAVAMTIPTSVATPPGVYKVAITGTSGALSHSATTSFTIANSFQLAVTKAFPSAAVAGSQQSAAMSLTPNYSGSVNATCDATALSGTQCTLTPSSPITIAGTPITIAVLINIPNNAVPATYNVVIHVQDAGASGTPAQSVTLPFTVVQDYVIANLSSASQTITAGQSITYNLSVSPVGASYSNPVTLGCTIVPTLAGSCAFSPNPSELQSGAAAVVMTITTQTPSAQLRPRRDNRLYGIWIVIAGAAVCGAGGIRRRKHRSRDSALLAFAIGLLFSSFSCGGGGSNGGTTPPGGTTGVPITYTITVVGSPASISQAGGASVTLIVQ